VKVEKYFKEQKLFYLGGCSSSFPTFSTISSRNLHVEAVSEKTQVVNGKKQFG
jgi:hypothetical protein